MGIAAGTALAVGADAHLRCVRHADIGKRRAGLASRSVVNDDASLVARALAGDQNAFASLVDRYHGEAYALAYRFVRQREDAEDVVQEAFVRAYRALAQFDPGRPFGAWMYAITARLCIDFHRRRRLKTVSLTRQEEGTAGEEHEWEIADPGEGPEVALEREQEASRLNALIDRLSPDYRLAILLRHTHDLSYEEIAEATEVPLGTVKARIHRARVQLRTWLEEGGQMTAQPGSDTRPEAEKAQRVSQGESLPTKGGRAVHPESPVSRRRDR
jgi:RNA polymerase sigma-70 factor (ECF subfamily)